MTSLNYMLQAVHPPRISAVIAPHSVITILVRG